MANQGDTAVLRAGRPLFVRAVSVLVATAGIAGWPLASSAQDPAAAGSPVVGSEAPVDDALLALAAEAHVVIERVQESLQADLARYHDAGEQLAARERAESRIADVFRAHGITALQYEHVIFVIGTDEGRRSRFEQLLAQLKADEGQPRPGALAVPGVGSDSSN